MRDIRAVVREQVAPLNLPAARQQKIVDEWAAQLEDAYDDLRNGGLGDEDAWRELMRQLPDWNALRNDLLDAEPALMRMAHAPNGPAAQPRGRAAIAWARERLTAGLGRDLHSSLRQLAADRGFSAAIVLTLAICLGANAAIFTVVNAVLLRPLPVPQPERIIGMGDVYPTVTPNDILANDVPSYFDRRVALTALEEQAMFNYWFDTITVDDGPEELRGMRTTPSLFRVLGVAPLLGRTFSDGEGELGADTKIILSHGLWMRLYGGDPSAVGRTLRLGWTGQPYTIVGVMPRGFDFFDQGYDGHARTQSRGVQFWIPLAFSAAQKSESGRTRYGFYHIGRLRQDATLDQLRAQMAALHASNVERFPQFRFDELRVYPSAVPLQEAITRGIRRTLYLLWGGAGFVLFIGAMNIANLALARASARAREMTTRLALGAGRVQLARQLIIEALLPAVLGGGAGLGVAAAILRVLTVTGLDDLPNAAYIRIDGTVIACVAAASLLVGLFVGIVPALAAASLTVMQTLLDGSRTTTGGRTARRFRQALVVAQVGVSVVLLIAATLLFSSFRHLLEVDAGFTAARVTTATIFPPPSRYRDAPAVVALADEVLERIRSTPGVEAAGITTNIALSGFASPSTVSASRSQQPGDPTIVPSVVGVTPGYFEAMGTALVAGRYFSDDDRAGKQPVAIVDERLAARLWPGQDGIGRPIYRGESGPFSVVGIVRGVRFEGLAATGESIGTAYFPLPQAPPMGRLRWIAVKASSEPEAVARMLRSAVAAIDPDLPVSDVQTMGERTAKSLVPQSLAMTLAGMFAAVALVLSLVGIYSVLAHLVARRTREFGIRIALGSTVHEVFRLVLREGVSLIAGGLVLGAAGALLLGRVLEGQVFGVRPGDPLILTGVTVATGCVALAACLMPARRATQVNPVDVLADQ